MLARPVRVAPSGQRSSRCDRCSLHSYATSWLHVSMSARHRATMLLHVELYPHSATASPAPSDGAKCHQNALSSARERAISRRWLTCATAAGQCQAACIGVEGGLTIEAPSLSGLPGSGRAWAPAEIATE